MLWLKSIRIALAVLTVLMLCGCQPMGSGVTDEEKEPQFLIGRSRVNAMNYSGAIEAFEQALEMNPHSAAAHFELGWLYAEKEADPAAAIYHYQKYLKLHPGAANAETIRQHILRLKQELAKAALPIPPSSEIQRQFEHLTAENQRLRAEVDQLQNALAQAQAANAARSTPVSNLTRSVAPVAAPSSSSHPTASQSRSHRVEAGETPSSIARHYHVSLAALLSANPGVDPRRMQVGQILVVPRG